MLLNACLMLFDVKIHLNIIFSLKVFSDLLVDSYQVLMVTIASALQEIGYVFQVIHMFSHCLL